MRALLCFAFLLGLVSAEPCPPQYQLLEGRCIRPLEVLAHFTINNELPKYRNECSKDNAHLPIIKNDEENAVFNNIAKSIEGQGTPYTTILLDLICNETTRHLEWIDGTLLSYSRRNTVDVNLDCVSTQYTVASYPHYDEWYTVAANKNAVWFMVLCVYDGTTPTTPRPTEIPTDGQCGDYSLISNPTDGTKPCIKVFANSLSWNKAQIECARDFASLATINSSEENKYFWRTAISSNILHGMHIGAHQSPNDASQWTWSDGEIPFDDKTYDNFASFFPIPGAGECCSMVTENINAFWVNEDCNENLQPFICRRAAYSTIPDNCPSVAPKAGEDFFPPGFPTPDTACEYFLVVAANKLVELQVMTLVANDNKDYLEILEGSSGPHPIANLTGTIFTPTKFTTAKSNVMRVNWKPNGGGSGRGFRIRYNEVNP